MSSHIQAVEKLRLGCHASLRGSRQCSHMLEYAALVASPGALPDGLILVFEHPVHFHVHRGSNFLKNTGSAIRISRGTKAFEF